MTSANSGMQARKLAEALKSAAIPATDEAAVQLARRYAQLLDEARGGLNEAKVFADLGPKYLATLTALGLTLAGRGVKKETTPDEPGAGASPLDELRARRATRADRAKAVDAPAS